MENKQEAKERWHVKVGNYIWTTPWLGTSITLILAVIGTAIFFYLCKVTNFFRF